MKYELENRLAIRKRHRRGRMDTDVQGKCKLSFPFWTIVTHVRSIHAWIRTRPIALSKNESCRNTKLNMTKLDKSNSREGGVREPLIWNWDTRSWLSWFVHVFYHFKAFRGFEEPHKSLLSSWKWYEAQVRRREPAVPYWVVFRMDQHAQPSATMPPFTAMQKGCTLQTINKYCSLIFTTEKLMSTHLQHLTSDLKMVGLILVYTVIVSLCKTHNPTMKMVVVRGVTLAAKFQSFYHKLWQCTSPPQGNVRYSIIKRLWVSVKAQYKKRMTFYQQWMLRCYSKATESVTVSLVSGSRNTVYRSKVSDSEACWLWPCDLFQSCSSHICFECHQRK